MAAFRKLTDLVTAGVVPADLMMPKVAIARNRATAEDWEAWKEAHVVVGTVNVLSHGYPDVQRVPAGLFDLVLFDEAHHLPAPAWDAVLVAVEAPAILFTATPFRRDKRRLPGELVFSYPLARAMADGVYAPVTYRRVEPGAGESVDIALANAASARLKSGEHVAAGSRLLVRAGRVADAAELVELYDGIGVKLGLVHAGSSAAAMRKTIRRVNDGELDGFACVGSLVEGFDFPALKIAAYHRPHRSLAPTLQFIGRLARAGHGANAELLAVPDQVSGETRELYEAEVAWHELLPGIVDAAVHEERRTREYIEHAVRDGPVEIPPLAIAPPKSARIYRTHDLQLDLDVELGTVQGAEVVSRFCDTSTNLVAFVTRRVESPRWLRTDALDATIFEHHVACWVQQHAVLFVSTDSAPILRELLKLLGAQLARQIGAEDLSRLLWAAEIDIYHSVGMRETRPGRASMASYRMVAGRSAGEAVGPTEAHGSALGHVMGRPRHAQGRGTVGFSVKKSKLWEPDNAESYLGFREWCEERAAQLATGNVQTGRAPHLDIPVGDTFNEFTAQPLSAQLDDGLLVGHYVFTVNGTERHPAVFEVNAAKLDLSTLALALLLEDQQIWRGTVDCHGTVEGQGTLVVADRETGQVVDTQALLRDNPPLIYFSDGSVVAGAMRVPPRSLPGGLPAGVLNPVSWEGVDIEVEFGDAGQRKSVQQAAQEALAADARWVLTDHTSGELADFIAVREDGNEVVVTLSHCKKSSKPEPGHRVADLYDVLGQTAKNIRWTYAGESFWAEVERRLRERDSCRMVSGDEQQVHADLQTWKRTPPRMRFELHAVQPGIKAAGLEGWAGTMLILNVHLWAYETDARFVLVCS